jgi:aldehyde dehydrogenase (NAD+)
MQLNFIHNQSVASQSGQTLPVIDPSDGQTFEYIQRSNAHDIDMAVKSSGHGREKGFEALYGFTSLKTVAIHHG